MRSSSAERSARRRLLNLFRTRALDREIEEEIRFHLDERTRQYRTRNMPPDEAARLAHDRFGSVERAKAGMRAARLPGTMAFAAIGTVALVLVLGLGVKRWSAKSRVYELSGRIIAPVPILAPKPHYTEGQSPSRQVRSGIPHATFRPSLRVYSAFHNGVARRL